MLPVYSALALIGITVLLTIIVIFYLVKVLNIMMRHAEEERAAKLGIQLPPRVSWWDKLMQRLNDSVPVTEEAKVDTGHSYDGIRELDNHLPPWWTGLFYATIIWGVFYLVIYHVTDSAPLMVAEYNAELAEAEAEAKALLASRPPVVIDENTLEYNADAELIEKGRLVYTSNNCGSCHRADGGGNTIGPNLTDDYWIHGGHVRQVFATVNKGFVEKGMPAWGKVMSQEDVRNVAFYVLSLKGTNPPDAKAPQGELYVPEKPAVSDSTAVRAMN